MNDDEESSEEEYVPLRKRRQMREENIRVKRRKITQKIEDEDSEIFNEVAIPCLNEALEQKSKSSWNFIT